jgi:hypothetical protein
MVEGGSCIVLNGSLLASAKPRRFSGSMAFIRAGRQGKGETETPINRELELIATRSAPGSCVLIDDARCFGVLPDYSTLDELRGRLSKLSVGISCSPTISSASVSRREIGGMIPRQSNGVLTVTWPSAARGENDGENQSNVRASVFDAF